MDSRAETLLSYIFIQHYGFDRTPGQKRKSAFTLWAKLLKTFHKMAHASKTIGT
jgi:hypothetical protein